MDLLQAFQAINSALNLDKDKTVTQSQIIEFSKLQWFAEFTMDGVKYVRLSRNWCMRKDTGERILIPRDASVWKLDSDYLSGSGRTEANDDILSTEYWWESAYDPDGDRRRAKLAAMQQ